MPQTKSRYAYEVLREQIVAGTLAPGERLRLRTLAESLGLSEMPVREALRMLSRDGLVEFSDHRGATVTEIPLEDVRETISARMWLEILAVREAVPRHDATSLAAVRRALAAGAKAADAPALPVDAHTMPGASSARATLAASAIARSLNVPVGLRDSSFASRPGTRASAPAAGTGTSGVAPSSRVTRASGGVGGSRAAWRKMPRPVSSGA